MHQININIEGLSKIEGHLDMDVVIENNEIKDVKFKIMENKRFFEKAIIGKPFLQIPQLLSRICGTCSVAHLLAAIEAVEHALDYKPSEQTVTLRKLLTYGLMIRDHSLHLYIFTMPDVIGKDSILDFDEHDETEGRLLHDMFDLKRAGNKLSVITGGRAVHAPFPVPGGFIKYPTEAEIKETREELIKVRDKIFFAMEIFDKCDFSLKRDTRFVGLKTEDYSFLDGPALCSEGGFCVPEKNFRDQLKEVVIPYSSALGYTLQGKEYMVGALPRMNVNRDALHPNTKRDAAKYIARFPSNDVYLNNLAQAIEVLHSIDHAIEILETLKIDPKPADKLQPKSGDGVGVIEAPRGTLYHYVKLDEAGIVTNAEIVVPTAQNQINIENDIRHLVQEHLDRDGEKIDKDFVKFEIEKLIRAYDPCMSCATHFLKLNWKINESSNYKAALDNVKDLQNFMFMLMKDEHVLFDEHNNPGWAKSKGCAEYFTKRINDSDSVAFIVTADNKIVGYLSGETHGGFEWTRFKKISKLADMFVREEYRNKQIGTKLVDEFKKWAREKGSDRIEVTAYTSNVKGIQFYKKLGFDDYATILGINL